MWILDGEDDSKSACKTVNNAEVSECKKESDRMTQDVAVSKIHNEKAERSVIRERTTDSGLATFTCQDLPQGVLWPLFGRLTMIVAAVSDAMLTTRRTNVGHSGRRGADAGDHGRGTAVLLLGRRIFFYGILASAI